MAESRIVRIPILPFRMVNAHLVVGPGGCVLVDTGLPGSERAIEKVLARERLSFPDIKLMPTGGVDLPSLPGFIQAGASGVGVGSPLFNKDRVENGDWAWLETQTRAFVAAWRQGAGQ